MRSLSHCSRAPSRVFDVVRKGWINYYTAGEKVAERSTNIQWGSIVHSVGDSFKKEDIKLLEP